MSKRTSFCPFVDICPESSVRSLQFRSGADNWELAIDNSSIISISKLAGVPPSDLDQRFSPIDPVVPAGLEVDRRVDTVLVQVAPVLNRDSGELVLVLLARAQLGPKRALGESRPCEDLPDVVLG